VSRRLVGVTAVLVIVAGLVIYGGSALVRVWRMTRQVQGLERELADLRGQAARLGGTIDRLRGDPLYIEKLAREELGYVREGETVLKFPPAGR
jgi:cell division protein FtsB